MIQETQTALIFPGQGLDPKDILSCYQKLQGYDTMLARERMVLTQEAINKAHGIDSLKVTAVLEDETSPFFQMTSFVQPAVYTLSVLVSEITDTKGIARIAPKYLAGHSLGEYSALTRAGVFSFEDGINIVTFRGKVMQEACEKTPTVLMSINGLLEEEVENICQQTKAEIALINAPTLIVVGARRDAIPDIEQLAKEVGARRVTILQAAGAFHTSFMQEAASQLDQFIIKYEFKDPQIPVIANLTGEPSNSGVALKNHLVEGMISSVRWAKSIQTMRDAGVGMFGEVGPGRSLGSLNRINGISDELTINVLERFQPRSF